MLLTEMSAMSHAAKLAAYSSAQAHGGVAAADPHRLIVMLLDGAIERISTARGCMTRGETSEKARLINRAVSIIGELRNSLDPKAGGQLAANLGELYDYMGRRLLKATAENRVELLDEVNKLLHEIRTAWVAIPSEARKR
jgi:flagellar secretion chaperone FliS